MSTEREQQYAEAMGLHSYHAAWPNARARVDAVMTVADAEQAELRAENSHNEWACKGNQRLLAEAIERAEAAEAKAARVEALADELERDANGLRLGGEKMRDLDHASRMMRRVVVGRLREALAGPAELETDGCTCAVKSNTAHVCTETPRVAWLDGDEIKALVARHLDAHPDEKAELDRLVERSRQHAELHDLLEPAVAACPECEQGKHGNCDGTTWDDTHDREADCPCAKRGHA